MALRLVRTAVLAHRPHLATRAMSSTLVLPSTGTGEPRPAPGEADPVLHGEAPGGRKGLCRPLRLGPRDFSWFAPDPASAYHEIVRKYGLETGISAEVNGLCVHSLRATAATNALMHEADIAKVQKWLGHANVSTTRLYDRSKIRPEDSPTFRVQY